MATENKTTTSSQSQGSSSNSGVSTQSSTPAASSSKPATSSVTPLPQVNVSIPKIDAPVSPQNTEAAYAQRLNSGALKQNPLQVNTSQLNIPNIAGGQEQEQEETEKKYAQRLNAGGLKAAQPTKPQGTVDTAPKTLYDVNQRMVEAMYKDKRPTPEQLEEERKRNKRNAILASIGDGLAAFHKAYSYGRGVKPMELENLSDKMYNRLEKIRKEREANELAYQNARLRAASLDQTAAYNYAMMKFREKQQAETERNHAAMENIYANRITAGVQKADADRQSREKMAEDKNKAAAQLNAEKIAAQQKRAEYHESNVNARATNRAAGSGGSGGRGSEALDKNKTTTITNRRGQPIKTVTETTTYNPKSGGSSSSGSGGTKTGPSGGGKKKLPSGKKPLPGKK